MKKILLILALLLSSCTPDLAVYHNHIGCAAYWDQSSFPIHVVPDNSFKIVDVMATYAAIQYWNIRVERQVFTLRPGKYSELKEGIYISKMSLEALQLGQFKSDEMTSDVLGIAGFMYYGGWDGRMGRIHQAAIAVDEEAIETMPQYVKVIAHELGHAIGYMHDSNSDSLMYSHSSTITKQTIQPHHIKRIDQMIKGNYKGKTMFGKPACF